MFILATRVPCPQEPDLRECSALRTVVSGGEAMPGALVRLFRKALPHARLFNAYGPTEVTVASTGAGRTGLPDRASAHNMVCCTARL